MQDVGEVSSAVGPAPIQGFDEAHAAVRGDTSIQFELPTQPSVPGPPEPGQPAPRPNADPPAAPRGQRPEVRYDPPAALPPASGSDESGLLLLFWIFVGFAALGLIFLIVSRMLGWERPVRAQKVKDGAAPTWRRPEEAAARGLLDDADALAASGRYSEAAHLLLYRSIDQIDDKRPATIRKALTSRDIAALPAIPPSPAAAFATIVRAVERSLFGGRALDEAGWRDCRSAFERFAFAGEWQ